MGRNLGWFVLICSINKWLINFNIYNIVNINVLV